jgi:hypothetical protein
VGQQPTTRWIQREFVCWWVMRAEGGGLNHFTHSLFLWKSYVKLVGLFWTFLHVLCFRIWYFILCSLVFRLIFKFQPQLTCHQPNCL